MSGPLIGDATPAEIRLAIVEAMITLAGHGSVPAATAAAKLVDELEAAQLQSEYKSVMQQASPLAAVEYLAALGVARKTVLRSQNANHRTKQQTLFAEGKINA